jgi:hypothetical protein
LTVRHAEQQGGLGREVPVDGDVGEPPDPQIEIGRGFVAERGGAQSGMAGCERNFGRKGDCARDHVGVHERDRDEAGRARRLQGAENSHRHGRERRDRQQPQKAAQRDRNCAPPARIDRAHFQAPTRNAQGPPHEMLGDRARHQHDREFAENLDEPVARDLAAELGVEPRRKLGRVARECGRLHDRLGYRLDLVGELFGERVGHARDLLDRFVGGRQGQHLARALDLHKRSQLLEKRRSCFVVLQRPDQLFDFVGRRGFLRAGCRRSQKHGQRKQQCGEQFHRSSRRERAEAGCRLGCRILGQNASPSPVVRAADRPIV